MNGNNESEMLTVKVDGSGSVCINFSDHSVHLIGRYLVVESSEDLPERAGWNVPVPLLVVKPESLFQLLLQGLVVLLLEVAGNPIERVEI